MLYLEFCSVSCTVRDPVSLLPGRGGHQLRAPRLWQIISTPFSCRWWSFKAPTNPTMQTWIPFSVVFKTLLSSSRYKHAGHHFLNRNKTVYAKSIHTIYPPTSFNTQKYKTPFNLCNSVSGWELFLLCVHKRTYAHSAWFNCIYMHKYSCYEVADPLCEITQHFHIQRIETFDLKKKIYLLVKNSSNKLKI